MNFVNTVIDKQLCAVILVLFLGACAGYSVSNATQPQTIEEQLSSIEYDVYSDMAPKVNNMMQGALNNPSDYNLLKTNNDLALVYKPLAKQETGDNKEIFMDYLDACIDVIDEKQAGNEAKEEIAKMNELYNRLVPE